LYRSSWLQLVVLFFQKPTMHRGKQQSLKPQKRLTVCDDTAQVLCSIALGCKTPSALLNPQTTDFLQYLRLHDTSDKATDLSSKAFVQAGKRLDQHVPGINTSCTRLWMQPESQNAWQSMTNSHGYCPCHTLPGILGLWLHPQPGTDVLASGTCRPDLYVGCWYAQL